MTSGHIPLPVAVTWAVVVGLFVGSFLNVVVYRTPLGLSVSTPRSFCPTCNRQLAWWENIPVASWVALHGRCRTCHQPISVRYPLVELATAASFGLVTWAWAGTIVSVAYCVLAASMIAVGLIEYSGKRAPLSVAAIGTGLAQVIIVVGAGWHAHWRIVVGSLVGTVIALVMFALLRVADPDCDDPRGHGRTALLIAGCWMGALRIGPIVVGAASWIVVFFFCMLGAWSMNRQPARVGAFGSDSRPMAYPLLSTPLVSAIGVALMASLIAAG